MRHLDSLLTATTLGLLATTAAADVITFFNFDTVTVGGRNLSFAPVPDNSGSPAGPGAFPNGSGDLWGVINESINDDVLDNSLHDPLDDFGVLIENFDGNAFAAEDLQNPDNCGGTARATWTFDISGYTDVTVSLSAVAAGNFETFTPGETCNNTDLCNGQIPPCISDFYTFKASIDGGAPVTIFSVVANEGASMTYTLQSGFQFTLPDPLALNATLLSNVFQTFTSTALGTGSVLTLTVEGQGDGSEEVFIFDDIVISGTPGSSCPADFNGDGFVTGDDFDAYVAEFELGNPGADFNGDGFVSGDDFDAFVLAFEAGC